MPNLAFIALLGLLLLVPLELLFLVILAALRRRPETPKIVLPEQKGRERYGWEDYLKLPIEKKKAPERNIALAALAVVAAVLLVAVPFFFVFPQLGLFNQSVSGNETEIASVEETTVEEAAGVPATGVPANVPINNFSINLTLPGINFTFPRLPAQALNITSFERLAPYKPYIYAVVFAVLVIAAALGVFVYFVNLRRMAVVRKAKATAERLIKKQEKNIPQMK